MTRWPTLLVLFLLPAAGAAMEVLQKSGRAELLTPAVRGDGGLAVSFAEVLLFTVRVEGGADLEVQAPPSWTTSPGWRATIHQKGSVISPSKGRAFWQETFRVDPSAPGTQPLQLEPVRYREGDGAWQSSAWRSFLVKVTSRLRDTDPKDLRERIEIEELPAKPAPSFVWISWVVAAAGMLVLGWVAVQWKRRPRLPRSAEEIARHELNRLAILKLPERGNVEEFHTLLANVVRRYLEKKHQFPARRQTTGEFLASLDQSALSAEQKVFLRDFLRACDLAKFAQAQRTGAECHELMVQVRGFIKGA